MAVITIVENYVDPAGFRRVRVQIDGGECLQFKFPKGMTTAEMKEIGQAAIDASIARAAAEAAERNRIAAITNGVMLYFAGSLTTGQKGTLLDALAVEWQKR